MNSSSTVANGMVNRPLRSRAGAGLALYARCRIALIALVAMPYALVFGVIFFARLTTNRRPNRHKWHLPSSIPRACASAALAASTTAS
jgi:hypothetical protein